MNILWAEQYIQYPVMKYIQNSGLDSNQLAGTEPSPHVKCL